MSDNVDEKGSEVTLRPEVKGGPYDSIEGFEMAARMAAMLCRSSLVPDVYQAKGDDDKTAMANVMIVMGLAKRTGTDPLTAMQNIDVIYGRPTWRAKAQIAMINSCGKFRDSLEFHLDGEGDNRGCYCTAVSRTTGKPIQGPRVDIATAKRDGWHGRKNAKGQLISKWQTLPDLMLQYRAASWFASLHCPEVTLGMQTTEEATDSPLDVTPEVELQPEPTPAQHEVKPSAEPERQNRRGGKKQAEDEAKKAEAEATRRVVEEAEAKAPEGAQASLSPTATSETQIQYRERRDIPAGSIQQRDREHGTIWVAPDGTRIKEKVVEMQQGAGPKQAELLDPSANIGQEIAGEVPGEDDNSF